MAGVVDLRKVAWARKYACLSRTLEHCPGWGRGLTLLPETLGAVGVV